ncbi:MAG TPA: hypothetical protein VF212_17015 [Longimicrobiales bacterium]
MLLTIFALITLGVTVLLAVYLWRVPEGPWCPRCGAATLVAERAGAPGHRAAGWLDRWAAARSCAACGWSGRQRHGREPQSVRATGRPGSRE